MKTDFLTIEEVDAAIAAQEKAKEACIQQANFHGGYVACLKEVRERMVAATDEQQPTDQAPPAEGKLVELAKPKRK